MEQSSIQFLLRKYVTGSLSGEEWEQLNTALHESEDTVKAAIAAEMEQHEPAPGFRERNYEALLHRITTVDQPQMRPVVRNPRRWWRAAAAAVLLGCIAGAYLLWTNGTVQNDIQSLPVTAHNDAAPGKNGAVLMLSNGRQIVLDSLENGVVATEGDNSARLDNGQLVYETGSGSDPGTRYNTMQTPNGREFQVTLPDGSRVWLNAASAIRYPVPFQGNERKVEISGEVYFEVMPDPQRPFRVQIDDRAEIEVLGTRFNINAYKEEESLRATLLEGAVRFHGKTEQVVLKPGQQARLSAKLEVVDNVKTDKIMAWRNGLFNFEGMRLDEVMRQLGRWYDMEIVYQGKVPEVEFYGDLDRHVSLAGVLKALESADIKFRIEGKRLIVLP